MLKMKFISPSSVVLGFLYTQAYCVGRTFAGPLRLMGNHQTRSLDTSLVMPYNDSAVFSSHSLPTLCCITVPPHCLTPSPLAVSCNLGSVPTANKLYKEVLRPVDKNSCALFGTLLRGNSPPESRWWNMPGPMRQIRMKLLLLAVYLNIPLLAACGTAPTATPIAVLPTATPTVTVSATPTLTPTAIPTATPTTYPNTNTYAHSDARAD